MTKEAWVRLLRYTFAGALFVLTGVTMLVGAPWYVTLGIAVTGCIILLGTQRRTVHPGVSRTTDAVICRYLPWYESNAYFTNVLLPLLGIAVVAAGYAPENPAWLRYGGIALLSISALLMAVTVFIWRRSLLCITARLLTVRIAERGSAPTSLRREQIQSIELKDIHNVGAGTDSAQVEIVYCTVDTDRSTPKTMLISRYLSVAPLNLAEALTVWNNNTATDEHELLDRIEQSMRGNQ